MLSWCQMDIRNSGSTFPARFRRRQFSAALAPSQVSDASPRNGCSAPIPSRATAARGLAARRFVPCACHRHRHLYLLSHFPSSLPLIQGRRAFPPLSGWIMPMLLDRERVQTSQQSPPPTHVQGPRAATAWESPRPPRPAPVRSHIRLYLTRTRTCAASPRRRP